MLKEAKSLEKLSLWIPSHSTEECLENVKKGMEQNKTVKEIKLLFKSMDRLFLQIKNINKLKKQIK